MIPTNGILSKYQHTLYYQNFLNYNAAKMIIKTECQQQHSEKLKRLSSWKKLNKIYTEKVVGTKAKKQSRAWKTLIVNEKKKRKN